MHNDPVGLIIQISSVQAECHDHEYALAWCRIIQNILESICIMDEAGDYDDRPGDAVDSVQRFVAIATNSILQRLF